MSDTDDRARGEAARRRVLGDAYVDAVQRAATAFTREFDEFITRYAWGGIWTREGLDDRTRRILVLGTLIALGRWEEFAIHVRTALADGVDEQVLQEIILQQAVYCGVPAAHRALHVAAEAMKSAESRTDG